MPATDPGPVPLHVASLGLATDRRVRRILELAGYRIALGVPRAGKGAVAVWGAGSAARRGAWLALKCGVPLYRLEDAFLRSLHPGRSGEAPLGLILDRCGLHHDGAAPSELETLLATRDLSDPALLRRAREARAAMARAHLSKYAATVPSAAPPRSGHVVVIDQTRGDAATRGTHPAFRAMLAAARAEHPDAPILLKMHPETRMGLRPGHYTPADVDERTSLLADPVSPWELFAGARAVYTHSSTLGLEAIWAGLRPEVFGMPIYAGWGLTRDRTPPPPRRTRALSVDQLFAGTMVLAPVWYDPYRDRLCEVEQVIETLAARARAWREDRHGWTAGGISVWKRRHMRAMFGQASGVRFTDTPAPPRRHMAWARAAPPGAVRVEDGFLRSRGLGAALTPPLSLALDDLGIYYDPSRESRMERLIDASATLPDAEIERARRLRARIHALGLSKYNIPAGNRPDLPEGPLILVAGQVEDDASVLAGTSPIGTNAALLAAARDAHPGARILYKPHPDVEAGLRKGALRLPDGVIEAPRTDPAALLPQVARVWTMTSLLGFEALLREVPVTVTGAPFYAGWGLTRDLGPVPGRRRARPTLDQLTHAVLIGYPRYHDPVTNMPCPVEIAVERLAADAAPAAGGLLAALQALRPRRGPRRGRSRI